MDSKQILDNLSNHLKNTLARAIGFATSLKHQEVTPLHLLFSTLQEKGSLGSDILQKLKFEEKEILSLLEKKTLPNKNLLRGAAATATLAELSELSKKALEKAMLLAYEYEQNYVGTEHLLYGILHTHDEEIEKLFLTMGIEREDIEEQIVNILESGAKFPDVEDISSLMEELSEMSDNLPPSAIPLEQVDKTPKNKSNKSSAIDLFTVNLTDRKEQKNIDPVIGRENEIERVINILCRRTKNNPVLIGEPGVGKTAIVEGLAKRISEGTVPEILRGKKILSLDLTLLISGTIYRGEFEARLRQIIEEVSKQDNYILFIDEIHNIIGTGSNQGTMDAANILKPALARGKLRCIGATTFDEYKKYISNDPALERRFQSIQVEEPSRDDAVTILQGVAPLYEKYHEVKIAPALIEKIVDLSIRFIHDNFLPDKAIDILDEACASVRVHTPSLPQKAKLQSLESELEAAHEKKQDCIMMEKFEEAKKWKIKEENLLQEIQLSKKKVEKLKPAKRVEVTVDDVAGVLSKRLHTEKQIFLQDEYAKLQNLRENLKKYIIGQDASIEKIVDTLERSTLGLKNPRQPFASFLFVGPTGVGKTELAKLLATELYHDEKALIKMDMSEFAEAHGVSKLLGSPAGYIGYKERNHFTEKLRQRPYSVVLFDEVDKAHGDVLKLLLQILDEGELTESNGKKLSFRHCVIILTSNVGSEFFKRGGIGFGESKDMTLNTEKEILIMSSLKENFGSPLLGRLDSVCLFSPLQESAITSIIHKRIQTLSSMLQKQSDISIFPDDKALQEMTKKIEKDLGARGVDILIEKILSPIVLEYKKKGTQKKKMKLTFEKGNFSLV